MRNLEHAIAELRGAARRGAARLSRTDPASVEPARLVLRLDDHDLPGTLGGGDPLTLAQWRRLMTSVVTWLGPVPVTFLAWHRANHPYLLELIRFAHRLECPTLLCTDGTGIDRERAEELVDHGLGAVRLWVGGASEGVHRAVVGNALSDVASALEALLAARKDRGAALDIEIGIPWQGPVHTEVKAIIGWARQAGADGYRVVAPWRATDLPSDPELLDALSDEERPFHRTPDATFDELHAMVAASDGEPGLPRRSAGFGQRRFHCPVGGLRMEVGANGRLCACPFQTPIAQVSGEDDDLRALWGAAGPHLQAIAACGRSCANVEVAPSPILP